MDFLNKIMNVFYADRSKANADETNFILFKYTPNGDDEKKTIEKSR